MFAAENPYNYGVQGMSSSTNRLVGVGYFVKEQSGVVLQPVDIPISVLRKIAILEARFPPCLPFPTECFSCCWLCCSMSDALWCDAV